MLIDAASKRIYRVEELDRVGVRAARCMCCVALAERVCGPQRHRTLDQMQDTRVRTHAICERAHEERKQRALAETHDRRRCACAARENLQINSDRIVEIRADQFTLCTSCRERGHSRM